jgi:hypothetical protein
VNDEEMLALKNKIQSDPTFKAVFGESLWFTLLLDRVKPHELHQTICQEPFRTIPEVIYSKKDFYLLHEINAGIEQVKSGGLYDFWRTQFVDKSKMKKSQKVIKKLQLKHFEGCFGILLVGYLISIVVFGVEKALEKLRT